MKTKEWTVLAYLNGNNELEPEMWKSKLDMDSSDISDKVNVVIEIGRASESIVRIMRPQEKFTYDEECWSGVRRYVNEREKSIFVEDLGSINMADYKNLYKFIEWGINNYPAKRYMLVVAGHGFLVLTLSDLCSDKPYTMGIYEMCTAINNIKVDLDVNIDILVLDICFMNNIETIYELAKNKNNTVKYMLTYIEQGPMEGLPYKKVMRTLDESNTSDILKNMIDDINLDLVAVKIDHNKANKVKYLSNKIGYEFLSIKEKLSDDKLYKIYFKDIIKEINKIIVCKSYIEDERFPIQIITEDMYNIENLEAFTAFYYKLSFSKSNYWANVVAKKTLKDNLNLTKSTLENAVLSKNNIYSFVKILNPNFTEEEIKKIIIKLYKYRKWMLIDN